MRGSKLIIQIMEAYDNALVNNMMAQPAFQRHFGEELTDGTYQVPAAWQSACSYASTVGEHDFSSQKRIMS